MIAEEMVNLGEKKSAIRENFEYGRQRMEQIGKEKYYPEKKHEFGMYLDGAWYRLTAKEQPQTIKNIIRNCSSDSLVYLCNRKLSRNTRRKFSVLCIDQYRVLRMNPAFKHQLCRQRLHMFLEIPL